MTKSEKKLKKHDFSPFPVKIQRKCTEIWPKFTIMCPTLGKYFWQNSETIFVTKFFSRTRIMYNLSSKSAIFNHFLDKIELKFIENQLNSCTTPYSKFIENQWKVIINSWKSMKINEIFVHFLEKISYFSTKLR